MKKLTAGLTILCLSMTSFAAIDGKKIFEENSCPMCHKETKDAIGPSLKTISEFYKNNPKQLMQFFKGQTDPIVWPDRFDMMKTQMGKFKAMSEEELKALIDYILKY
ncbi:c-type cytochrome [Persephonella sp. IF05-L8]|uniref:c-type cytochrome n=1 Tax=Persephonella sp. IF05-L8 TaxID=1158338 RepID=UPI000496C71E